MTSDISIIILAAGEGKRMRSDIPKVLHRLASKTLLAHVVDTAKKLSPQHIYVIYGSQRPQVAEQAKALGVEAIVQQQQLGTAHAVNQALPYINDNHRVLILYGDVPLISEKSLKNLLLATTDSAVWLTAHLRNPHGMGRIIRDYTNKPRAIIEETDLSNAQKSINEINSGICLLPVKQLKDWLKKIDNDNAQNEYYLTDCFELAAKSSSGLITIHTDQAEEIQGVNDRLQLAHLERIYQQRQAKKLMKKGVSLIDPERFDLRGELKCDNDVSIDINVIIEGRVNIGRHSHIGPNVYLRDVTIGDHVTILANSVLEGADIESHCEIGPFARLRPDTYLQSHSRIGNFVEVKKSRIGEGSKVNHLSYIGDTNMGNGVNIGAGTITCNYDGANKHPTTIEDNVFIGSNNCLVAPVKIGQGATTGAGSTIRKSAPAAKLSLSYHKQRVIDNWQRPCKSAKDGKDN